MMTLTDREIDILSTQETTHRFEKCCDTRADECEGTHMKYFLRSQESEAYQRVDCRKLKQIHVHRYFMVFG